MAHLLYTFLQPHRRLSLIVGFSLLQNGKHISSSMQNEKNQEAAWRVSTVRWREGEREDRDPFICRLYPDGMMRRGFLSSSVVAILSFTDIPLLRLERPNSIYPAIHKVRRYGSAITAIIISRFASSRWTTSTWRAPFVCPSLHRAPLYFGVLSFFPVSSLAQANVDLI